MIVFTPSSPAFPISAGLRCIAACNDTESPDWRTETASTLVPVILSEAAPPATPIPSGPPAPSQSRRKRSDVTIELGRGRRIRVDSDIDTEALGRILDVVLERR